MYSYVWMSLISWKINLPVDGNSWFMEILSKAHILFNTKHIIFFSAVNKWKSYERSLNSICQQ
jgi:hypothetical protein